MRNWINLIEGSSVWHGSPHHFDVFDIRKINSGEGNQAYGWGLYFAQEHAVANYYQKTLSNIKYNGHATTPEQKDAIIALMNCDWDVDEAVSEHSDKLKTTIREIDRNLVEFEGGCIYEVEAPSDEFLLDWDADYSAQSTFVQKAIRKIHAGADAYKTELKRYVGQCVEDDNDGKVLYHHIGNWARNEATISFDDCRKMTSLLLLKAGILGIKYIDAGSRESDRSTLNYVIFDSQYIRIISKDSLNEKVVERFMGWELTKNPSRNEYRKLVLAARVKEGKVPLRGLITLDDKRDVYLWDSYQAAHGGIKDRYDLENSMHIFVADDNAVVSVLTLWRYERLGYDRKQIDELVRTNPVLNRIFPQGFQILIED